MKLLIIVLSYKLISRASNTGQIVKNTESSP